MYAGVSLDVGMFKAILSKKFLGLPTRSTAQRTFKKPIWSACPSSSKRLDLPGRFGTTIAGGTTPRSSMPFPGWPKSYLQGDWRCIITVASQRSQREKETGFEGLQVHEPKTQEEAQEEASRNDKEPIAGPYRAQRALEHGLYGRRAVRCKED